MPKIRNHELSRLAAEVLPERAVLGPLLGAIGLGGNGAGLPSAGQPATGGGLTRNLPLLGGGAHAGGPSGAPSGASGQELSAAFSTARANGGIPGG